MNIIDWTNATITNAWCLERIPAPHQSSSAVESEVAALLEEVKVGGVAALRRQAEAFDHVTGHEIAVSPSALSDALAGIDPSLLSAIEESIRRVRLASVASLRPDHTTQVAPGATVTLRWRPVERAGVYVPGGKAVYPSSVVMNVVAAQVAGVESIALVSPPQADSGGVHPTILATAQLLGISEVYAMGGAGAIAALAYGVHDVGLEPVSVITGPGNQYVATAKGLVRGIVGIDSEAGPTEIVIIADAAAPEQWMAADLVSQAEHDELAGAVLITTDRDYATRVGLAVAEQAEKTPHRDRVIAALSGQQSAIYCVASVDDAIVLSDFLAPEHLQIVTADADSVAERIRHAGAIFLGPHTPVSVGDYAAGSNHVLPTGRRAQFQSGLSPLSFLRSQQVVRYSDDALAVIGPKVVDFARAEHLPAHADAISIRLADTEGGGS